MTSTAPQKRKYADVSLGELVHWTTVMARIPFVLLWLCAKNLLFYRQTFRRTTASAMIRWFNKEYSVAQIQYITPPSVDAYKAWAKSNNLPITVEELVDDTALMWIGPKRTDKVVLYFPGGAYFAPLLDFPIAFWHYVQNELKKVDCDVGFAILGYTLLPTAGFPTQLRQATVAVEHVLTSGVHPSNLHIVGDSAGGNLILSLLSHILHPLPGIRPMTPLQAPLRGVYLMSPWVAMKSNAASFKSNTPQEMFSTANVEDYGALFLAHVPSEREIPYAEALRAPDEWFAGLDGVVDRVLMTAGGEELFRDDIIQFSQTLSRVKPNEFTFVVQEGGYHDDPFLDFLVKLPLDQLGSLTPLIVHWLAAGIKPPQ
ncbi:Alpha/Beta hydrolase protein [Flammula alnicola]|nr:Alpha/Beta hydrolase protein [Flammula alnicola]